MAKNQWMTGEEMVLRRKRNKNLLVGTCIGITMIFVGLLTVLISQ